MARGGFLNENTLRRYPFAAATPIVLDRAGGGTLALPDSAVVEFGAALGPPVGSAPADVLVYLAGVGRSGSTLRFEFRTTAAALADATLAFEFPVTAPGYTLQFAEAAPPATSSSDGSSGGDCRDLVPLEGFLQVGDLAELAGLLADGESAASPAPEASAVEPALVRCLDASLVLSVNLANDARTPAGAASDCTSEGGAPAGRKTHAAATCLAGVIPVRAGYNADVRQDDGRNAIVLSAALGAGLGEPCGEVPAFPGDDVAAAAPGVASSCAGLVRSVVGLGGPAVSLRGAGVRSGPHPSLPHTLLLELDAAALSTCIPTLGGNSSTDAGSTGEAVSLY